MTKKRLYLAGFLIIAGAIGYLITTTFRSSLQYYVTAREAAAAKASYGERILKIAGTAGEIERVEEPDGAFYKFTITEEGATIAVSYRGFVPDTFKDGASTVVTGSFADDGTFRATHILAKCASKYEAMVKEEDGGPSAP